MAIKIRRSGYLHKRKQIPNKRGVSKFFGRNVLIISLILFCLIFIIYFFLSFKASAWNNFQNLLIINSLENNDLSILSIDKKNDKISQLVVSGNTIFDASFNFGKYRVKNLYELDKSQKYHGNLLLTSVQKNTFAPVYMWTKHNLMDIKPNKFLKILSYLSDSSETNMSLTDRISLFLYLLPRNRDITITKLEETGFVKKNKDTDGESLVTGDRLPTDLAILWVNDYVSENQTRFEIINTSNERVLPDGIYKIFESSGAKVSNLVNNTDYKIGSDANCVVVSEDSKLLLYYASIFRCRTVKRTESELFDFSIAVTKKFIDIYR